MQITRRGLLVGTAAGGGLLVAWWLMPRSCRSPLIPVSGEHIFGAWLTIAADGVVTVAVPQLEMGQGITTLLPQIVAVELGADWRQVAVEPAPVSGAFANIPLAKQWIALWDPALAGMSPASEAPPADPGKLGAVVAPPAIANALFSATGLRLRRLPLLSDGI
jgi:isoquinoline 1-oxidoreductase beta subunit